MASIIQTPNLFIGEKQCALCARMDVLERSKRSGWRAIEIDGAVHFICPKHLPPEGSRKRAFKRAYARILPKLSKLRNVNQMSL